MKKLDATIKGIVCELLYTAAAIGAGCVISAAFLLL